jgi:CBS domain-containing protein
VNVEDVMTRDVITVTPRATLKAVAETLSARRISGVPVVEGPRVVGVVSEADILAKEARESQPTTFGRLLRRRRVSAKRTARTAGEAMTSPPLTVSQRCDVSQAARLMVERGINRLPVVSEDDVLVGIVTRADLVRAFVRSDDEIARELRQDVAVKTLWLDPDAIEISVRGGEVTLDGKVDQKVDADLLALLAARVPGVVSVRSDLVWRVDSPRVPESDPHVPHPPRR